MAEGLLRLATFDTGWGGVTPMRGKRRGIGAEATVKACPLQVCQHTWIHRGACGEDITLAIRNAGRCWLGLS